MGVKIKNMEMFVCCSMCPFVNINANYPRCIIDNALGNSNKSSWEDMNKIPDWCPLEEIEDK